MLSSTRSMIKPHLFILIIGLFAPECGWGASLSLFYPVYHTNHDSVVSILVDEIKKHAQIPIHIYPIEKNNPRINPFNLESLKRDDSVIAITPFITSLLRAAKYEGVITEAFPDENTNYNASNINFVSMRSEPDDYLRALKQLSPGINAIEVMLNSQSVTFQHKRDLWLESANSFNIKIMVHGVNNYRSGYPVINNIFETIKPFKTAVFVDQAILSFRDNEGLSIVMDRSWRSNVLTLTNSIHMVKNGIAFTTVPAITKYAELIITVATRNISVSHKPRHNNDKYDVFINLRVLRHLKIDPDLERNKHFIPLVPSVK